MPDNSLKSKGTCIFKGDIKTYLILTRINTENMNKKFRIIISSMMIFITSSVCAQTVESIYGKAKLINKPDNGFRGFGI